MNKSRYISEDQTNIIISERSEAHRIKSIKLHIVKETVVNKSACAGLLLGALIKTIREIISPDNDGNKCE